MMSLWILSSTHDYSQVMKTFVQLMIRTLISDVPCVETKKGKSLGMEHGGKLNVPTQ